MIKANFNAYGSYVTDSLYQWDLNQVLQVIGLRLDVAPEVHFANAAMDRAIPRQATLENGVMKVNVPNTILQHPLRIHAYIGIYEGETFKVIETVEIPVIPKKRPTDYVFEDTDGEIYSYNNLENQIANIRDLWIETHDQQVKSNVYAWLEEHPEATTTVQDRSLSVDKLIVGTLGYVTPQMFGAKGDGVTDDTEAFVNCLKSRSYIIVPEGIYLVDPVVTAENSIIEFNNAVFKRKTHGVDGFLISFSENNVVYGFLTVDGDKSNATINTESGVLFSDGCKSYGTIVSKNNTRHGVKICNNNEHYYIESFANGLTGGTDGSGLADGIYVMNGESIIIHKCHCYDNKRNGLTLTTYDETGLQKRVLSKNVVIRNIFSHDNVYCDIDVEGVSHASVYNAVCTGSFSASNSENTLFEDCTVGTFYANNSDNVKVNNMHLNPLGNVNHCFYVNGTGAIVENVHLHDTADAYSSNTFCIEDSEGCIIKNILIENGNNALVIPTCKHAENIKVEMANNRKITINDVRIPTNDFRIVNGLIEMRYANSTGVSGNIGDRMINIAPEELGESGSKYIIPMWVCVDANTWAECRVLTGK